MIMMMGCHEGHDVPVLHYRGELLLHEGQVPRPFHRAPGTGAGHEVVKQKISLVYRLKTIIRLVTLVTSCGLQVAGELTLTTGPGWTGAPRPECLRSEPPLDT